MIVEKPKKGKLLTQKFSKGSLAARLRSVKSHATRYPKPVSLAPVNIRKEREDER